MHEVSICQSIVDLVEEEFSESDLPNIRIVHLKIGMLSCLQPEFLKKVYEFMTADTNLKDSRLEFERTAILAECEHCRQNFEVKYHVFICPQCGAPSSKIVQGNELLVDKIIFEEYSYEEAI